jgi:L-aminopeptidase/D-esterase-like protein
MIRKGGRNLITDVEGLTVGQAEDMAVRTGVTVLVAEAPFLAVPDLRGGAPGTFDVVGLNAAPLVSEIDAIVLSGGSAFGLEASVGVQAWLKDRGRGFEIAPGAPRVPIVCGAILFDLTNGGNKDWHQSPYRALGIKAAENASADFALGNAGAGLGAIAGGYKGGIGSASSVREDGVTVGALVAVNSVGSPVMAGSDAFWAFAFEQDDEFGGRKPKGPLAAGLDLPDDMKGAVRAGANTTIAVVATDAIMGRDELQRVAIMAADGFARALRPAHTPFDGDLIFAVSTAKRTLSGPRPMETLRLGHMAADCLARAIARGVYEAESLGNAKSYRDTFA